MHRSGALLHHRMGIVARLLAGMTRRGCAALTLACYVLATVGLPLGSGQARGCGAGGSCRCRAAGRVCHCGCAEGKSRAHPPSAAGCCKGKQGRALRPCCIRRQSPSTPRGGAGSRRLLQTQTKSRLPAERPLSLKCRCGDEPVSGYLVVLQPRHFAPVVSLREITKGEYVLPRPTLQSPSLTSRPPTPPPRALIG